MIFKGSSDQAVFSWYNDSDVPFSRQTATALSARTWYHIAGVKSGTNIITYLMVLTDHVGASPTATGSIIGQTVMTFA